MWVNRPPFDSRRRIGLHRVTRSQREWEGRGLMGSKDGIEANG